MHRCTIARSLRIAAFWGLVAFLSAGRVDASTISFAGSTTACFGTCGSGFSDLSSDGFLTFDGTSFITGPLDTSVSSTTTLANLGAFTTPSSGNQNYATPVDFTLAIALTSPPITSPVGGQQSYGAIVSGKVTANGADGGVIVTFNPTTQRFYFSGGYADLMLTNTPITVGGAAPDSVTLAGSLAITSLADSPVPEPATLTLLGCGLIGVVAAARRRGRT